MMAIKAPSTRALFAHSAADIPLNLTRQILLGQARLPITTQHYLVLYQLASRRTRRLKDTVTQHIRYSGEDKIT